MDSKQLMLCEPIQVTCTFPTPFHYSVFSIAGTMGLQTSWLTMDEEVKAVFISPAWHTVNSSDRHVSCAFPLLYFHTWHTSTISQPSLWVSGTTSQVTESYFTKFLQWLCSTTQRYCILVSLLFTQSNNNEGTVVHVLKLQNLYLAKYGINLEVIPFTHSVIDATSSCGHLPDCMKSRLWHAKMSEKYRNVF